MNHPKNSPIGEKPFKSDNRPSDTDFIAIMASAIPDHLPNVDPFDPDLEAFTGELLTKYWSLLTPDNQETLRTSVQGFMLSRLRLPVFFQIHQVQSAYPHLYEFLKTTVQGGPAGFEMMIPSLVCECWGQYHLLDNEQGDDGVLDTYQCDGCATFCLVIWDPETKRELKRVYTTAEGDPL